MPIPIIRNSEGGSRMQNGELTCLTAIKLWKFSFLLSMIAQVVVRCQRWKLCRPFIFNNKFTCIYLIGLFLPGANHRRSSRPCRLFGRSFEIIAFKKRSAKKLSLNSISATVSKNTVEIYFYSLPFWHYRFHNSSSVWGSKFQPNKREFYWRYWWDARQSVVLFISSKIYSIVWQILITSTSMCDVFYIQCKRSVFFSANQQSCWQHSALRVAPSRSSHGVVQA